MSVTETDLVEHVRCADPVPAGLVEIGEQQVLAAAAVAHRQWGLVVRNPCPEVTIVA